MSRHCSPYCRSFRTGESQKMMVAFSLTRKGTPQTILMEVKPQGHEPIVKASVNKFYGTGLWDTLEEKGIKTVIITGTAAHGAVLHTATAASSQHKLKVIVPIDGLSASNLYIEQATLVNLITGPGTRKNTILTKLSLISIE
jgi:nicotinamidase-related amidase